MSSNGKHHQKRKVKSHNLSKFQQVSTTVQISIARPDDSNLTWIDFKYVVAQKVKATVVNMIYLEKPSLDKRLGFIVVNKSMRNSKELSQNSLLLILSQVD